MSRWVGIGPQATPLLSSPSTPWWKIALGATVIGAGYFLVARPMAKEIKQTIGDARTRARRVGIRPGMTQAEQDRAWDAHYARRGLRLRSGELGKIK